MLFSPEFRFGKHSMRVECKLSGHSTQIPQCGDWNRRQCTAVWPRMTAQAYIYMYIYIYTYIVVSLAASCKRVERNIILRVDVHGDLLNYHADAIYLCSKIFSEFTIGFVRRLKELYKSIGLSSMNDNTGLLPTNLSTNVSQEKCKTIEYFRRYATIVPNNDSLVFIKHILARYWRHLRAHHPTDNFN